MHTAHEDQQGTESVHGAPAHGLGRTVSARLCVVVVPTAVRGRRSPGALVSVSLYRGTRVVRVE